MAGIVTEKQKRILFITLSIFGVILILFFGIRALKAFRKFEGHRPPPFAEELQTDVETIEDWMTIPFISHNFGTPPELLFGSLNIDPRENHKKSLKELNDEFFPEADGYVLTTIKATVLAHQPPPMPDTPAIPSPTP
ncbi:MAG: hypothetical protein H6635_06485 [Anaerolineales bacterium]|nr:hypothetical protein [Anaerolineales bacterium]MCB9145000.1 hypothetical protein [Anaerolineales bacterium]